MTKSNATVVIFSGAFAPEGYEDLAYRVGKALALNGYITVTGGGPGMMRAVCRGAYEAKGESWGVCIEKREEVFVSDYFTKHEIHKTFDERNDRLISLGSSFIVLPGGLGTITEALQITQRKKFHELPKTTPLLFVGEYYRRLTDVFSEMKQAGFIGEVLDELYTFVRDEAEMITALKSAGTVS